MGWFGERLSSLDRRNQSVADYLLDHPDAGTKVDPYAKSTKARRFVVLGLIVIAIAAFVFGLVGVVVVGVPLLIAGWRLDYHPWLNGDTRERPIPPSDNTERRP